MRPLHSLYAKALSLLFPHRCTGCGKEGVLLCQPCWASLRPRSPACFICNKRNMKAALCPSCRKHAYFSHFYAPFSYAGNMPRELVHRLKYRFVREAGDIMGTRIAEGMRFYSVPLPKHFVIVPVPLHRSRHVIRGFNQAELIAQSVAKTFDAPLINDASVLIRRKKTKQQVSFKNPELRLQNIADAFYVLDATPVFRKNVLLIDDVATTGATLNEAAKALRRAGATSVWACTFAK